MQVFSTPIGVFMQKMNKKVTFFEICIFPISEYNNNCQQDNDGNAEGRLQP